jgi:hypothetical protein
LNDSAALCRRALAMAPDDALAYYSLGFAYRALKDDAAAAKNWLLAVRRGTSRGRA